MVSISVDVHTSVYLLLYHTRMRGESSPDFFIDSNALRADESPRIGGRYPQQIFIGKAALVRSINFTNQVHSLLCLLISVK